MDFKPVSSKTVESEIVPLVPSTSLTGIMKYWVIG